MSFLLNDDIKLSRLKIVPLIVYSFLIFILVNLFLIYTYIYNYKNTLINETTLNIYEYEEVDLVHICNMYSCKYIKNNNVLYKNTNPSGYPRLERTDDFVTPIFSIFDDVCLNSDFDILIKLNIEKSFVGVIVSPFSEFLSLFNNVYYFLFLFILSLNLGMLVYNIIRHKDYHMKQVTLLQHRGYYDSMIMLTENINHELNTPLTVINNRIFKLKDKLDDIISGRVKVEECSMDDMKNVFDIINASLIQISDTLMRLRPFKDAKKQTKRNIHEVMRLAYDMLAVQQHELFNYDIDRELYNYKIDSKYMRNGELTAILLNFFKNSIDANACNLEAKFNSYNPKTHILSFFLTDDGNGIPEALRQNIWKENLSSKSNGRGNGLYINKYIIESAEGKVQLKYSSELGTIFQLDLKAIHIEGQK